MALNKLKLNNDKTELLYLYSKHNPQQSLPPLRFGSDIIQPSSSSRNIGVVFDSTMSMLPHVKSVCKSAFYHLRNISRIRKLLSTKTTETLVHAFVTSKLDHCNSLYTVSPNTLLKSSNQCRMQRLDLLQALANSTASPLFCSTCTGFQFLSELNSK